jgi:hypothetical protein
MMFWGVGMTDGSPSRRFLSKPRHCISATFVACLAVIPMCHSYPTSVWQLEGIAQSAAVLATIKVEHVSKAGLPLQSGSRTVPGHVELMVLRSFPPSALRAGEHIRLDYETLAEGNSGMSGPERWALISASVVSSLGVPRPTIADFRASKYGTNLAHEPFHARIRLARVYNLSLSN